MASIFIKKGCDGKVRYRFVVRLTGHRPMSKTFARKTDGERWAAKVETGIRDGLTFGRQTTMTLADAIADYRRLVLPRKKASTSRSQQTHLGFWSRELGHLKLGKVKAADISKVRDRLLLEGDLSQTTIRAYLTTLTHVFSVCIHEWELLGLNPATKAKKPKPNPGRCRYLTPEELRRLLDACQESKNKLLHPAVLLSVCTGVRRAECLNLAWDRVDLARGWITLEVTKNGDRRGVPLVEPALGGLRRLYSQRRVANVDGTDLVFPGFGGREMHDMRTSFENAVLAAGIRDFRWHDLRHCAASYMAMSGVPLRTIGEVLGHRSVAMTMRYSHLSGECLTEAVAEAMNRFVGGGKNEARR